MLSRSRAVLALSAYLLVLGVHLVARVVGAEEWWRATQAALMPLLIVVVVVSPVPWNRLTGWVLAALAFSWAGDTVPAMVRATADDETAFMSMVALFAVAQLCYALAFWPMRSASVTGTAWPVAYGVAAAALVLVCAPGAGSMLAPVVGYAVVITVMAVLATGVHPLAGVGGVVFLASDALIALEAFVDDWEVAGQDTWVMLTYGVAQLLLVLGVLARCAAWQRELERPREIA